MSICIGPNKDAFSFIHSLHAWDNVNASQTAHDFDQKGSIQKNIDWKRGILVSSSNLLNTQ